MSYILEALKKAERQRRLGEVPTMGDPWGETTPRSRRPHWKWLLAGAVLLNSLLLIGVMVWRAPDPDLRAGHALPDTASSQSAAMDQPAPGEQLVSVQDTMTPTHEDVNALAARPAESNTVVSEAAGSGAVVVARQTGEPLVLTLPPTSAPFLADLPASFRDSLPKLTLTVHVYSAAPSMRFVFINDRRYQEGDRLREGPRLESIDRESILLSYQGQEFQLSGAW